MSQQNVAVFVGYVSSLLFMFIGLSLAYVMLGTEAAFQPESFKPSGLWILITFAAGVVASAVGAVVAGRMAPGTKASLALADVVLMLGFLFAVLLLIANASAETGPRSGDLSLMAAMAQAQQPAWVLLIYPLIAKVGVYLGAWMVRPDA